MHVRLILTLEGGATEFGADTRSVKGVLAAYLRSTADRIENLNDNSAVCSVVDDDTGDIVGRVNLAIVGGAGVINSPRHPSTNIGE